MQISLLEKKRRLLDGGGLGAGLGGKAEVRLDGLEAREEGGSLLVGDGGVDNDVVAVLPVGGGGDAVLVTELEGVNDTEDLVKVATGRGGVGEGEADGLLGVDDEDGADGEWDTLGIEVGQVLVIQHVVEGRDLAVGISDDGELDFDVVDLVDILDPLFVGLEAVGGETDNLDVALVKLGLEAGNNTELGGADGGEVCGVREENGPGVADEIVELDGALGGLGVEVGGDGAKTEGVAIGRHLCCWLWEREEVGCVVKEKEKEEKKRKKVKNPGSFLYFV